MMANAYKLDFMLSLWLVHPHEVADLSTVEQADFYDLNRQVVSDPSGVLANQRED